jgi:transposase
MCIYPPATHCLSQPTLPCSALQHRAASPQRTKTHKQSSCVIEARQQLLFETIETDLEARSAEIEKLASTPPADRKKQQPKRTPLPASLPRRDAHHEPARRPAAVAAS